MSDAPMRRRTIALRPEHKSNTPALSHMTPGRIGSDAEDGRGTTLPDGQGEALPTVELFQFDDDGVIPNNPTLPLLLYRGAMTDRTDRATAFEGTFRRNGWTGSWRNGIFAFPHFHSTAHEVLGIADGTVTVRLGGEYGRTVTLHPGDAVVIPAGVGHQKRDCEGELVVVGAYPAGQDVDLCRAVRDEHDRVAANVARVDLPSTDPLFGGSGPLVDYWIGRGALLVGPIDRARPAASGGGSGSGRAWSGPNEGC